MKHYVGVVCLIGIVTAVLLMQREREASLPDLTLEDVSEALFNAEGDQARIQMGEMAKAILLYKLTTKRVPDSLNDLTAQDENGEAYLEEVPSDPWDTPYEYRPDGRRRYSLRSAGPDRQLDTDDDVVHEER